MRIDVVTLFSEFFESPLQVGLLGKAVQSQIAEIGFVDPRKFTHDVHRTVDDAPYGGGAGMVMKAPPVMAAIEEAKRNGTGPVILLSPQGKPLTQSRLLSWSKLSHLVLVCGRYEGFDERIREAVDEEVSVGDFVLTGGEYGALTLIDGLVRLIPGTVGNRASTEGDSFSDNLLEHPQYTRPDMFGEKQVPEVLTSGDHARIAQWRHRNSLARTRSRRPDILMQRNNSDQDLELLKNIPSSAPNISLALPSPSLKQLSFELDRLLELIAAYNLSSIHLVNQASCSDTQNSFRTWKSDRKKRVCPVPNREGSRKQWKTAKDRALASHRHEQDCLDRLHFHPAVDDAVASLQQPTGENPIRTLIFDPADGRELTHVSPQEIQTAGEAQRYLICLGVNTVQAEGFLSGVRKHNDYNGLSSSMVAALLVERILGEA